MATRAPATADEVLRHTCVNRGRSPEHLIELLSHQLMAYERSYSSPKQVVRFAQETRDKIEILELEIARRDKANLGFKSVAALAGVAFHGSRT